MRTGSNWISFSFPERWETRSGVSIRQRNMEWCYCELCRLWYRKPAHPAGEHEQFWTIPGDWRKHQRKSFLIFWEDLLERFTCVYSGYGDIHWYINDALAGAQLPERFERCPLLPLQQAGKSSFKWQVFLKAVISLEWPLLFQNLSLEDLGGISFIVSMKGTRNASYLIFIVDCRHADSP